MMLWGDRPDAVYPSVISGNGVNSQRPHRRTLRLTPTTPLGELFWKPTTQGNGKTARTDVRTRHRI